MMCRTLGKVKTTGIEKGTLAAFEDFLCALIRGSFDVTDVLKDNGVISVCQVQPMTLEPKPNIFV